MQVVKQTDKQKMAMYMKLPKKKIIEMLIQCNKVLDSRKIVVASEQNTGISYCYQSDGDL